MVLKYKKQKKETPNDWNFDFSEYEQEEKQEQKLRSVKEKKPRITGLRSKFSPSSLEIEALEQIKIKISEYAIKTASRTTEIKDLWTLYGCLNEYWGKIHDIYGTLIINEMNKIDKYCLKLLEAATSGEIPDQLYKGLLYYRNTVYKIAQRSNLGIEVERSTGSHFNKAKKGIIE